MHIKLWINFIGPYKTYWNVWYKCIKMCVSLIFLHKRFIQTYTITYWQTPDCPWPHSPRKQILYLGDTESLDSSTNTKTERDRKRQKQIYRVTLSYVSLLICHDCLRTFSGLSRDFFRTLSGLSKKFLRTFTGPSQN